MEPKKAAVWLDLDSCRVPDGVDPRCIRPMIESALKKKSHDFEDVTIFAMGNIMRVPALHIKAMDSSGIIVKHTHFGASEFHFEFLWWETENPPPAAVMFITENDDRFFLDRFSEWIFGNSGKYTALPAYPRSEFCWNNLLKEIPNTPVEDKSTLCPWVCTLCRDLELNTYRDFAIHLYSVDHANMLFSITHSRPRKFIEVFDQFMIDLRQVPHLTEVLRDIDEDKGPSEFQEKDDANRNKRQRRVLIETKDNGGLI